MKPPRSVDPTQLRDFLKSLGWHVVPEAIDDEIFLFRHPEASGRELAFPSQKDAPDYSDAVEIVVHKLQDMISLDERALFARIAAVKDDVLRLRIYSDSVSNSIPLDYAANFVKSTEKLLKAAACTVLRPRPNHPRLTLTEASQLVEKTRFGQTEEGSFILSVSCPINALDVQGSLELNDQQSPFVRRVFSTVHDSISVLIRSIKADTVSELVDDTKRSSAPLISSNFCEAISAMYDERTNNSLDAMFSWSQVRPKEDARFSRPLSIQRDYFSIIEEVRRELKSSEDAKPESYIGTVERLDGEMGSDGRRSGNVVLSLLLPEEGETVRAKIMLSPEDYMIADKAHMTNGAYIRVWGRLLPGRQPRQLVETSNFELLEDRAHTAG